MAEGNFTLKIYRGTPGNQYWEEYELPRRSNMNIIAALMEIQRRPVTRQGKQVEPVVWEMACLEEVCGSCSMLINKVPKQACTAIIENEIKQNKSDIITLAPFTKFPLIRDLVVDRTIMFDRLKEIKGWVPVEQLHQKEFGPKIDPHLQSAMYMESTCMTCGCCQEACPQVNSHSSYIGPHPINQVKLFNENPIGKILKRERLTRLMKKGGLAECGNSQNCVQVCPKKIELTQSIAKLGKDTTKEALSMSFGLPEMSE